MRTILFVLLVPIMCFTLPANASLKIKAGYQYAPSADNAGRVGIFDGARSNAPSDGTVLGKSATGLSASAGFEGLLFGSRLTYDYTSTGNKTAALTFSGAEAGSVTTNLTTSQYGFDIYVRTPTPFISIYGGVGAMYVKANLHEAINFKSSLGLTDGSFDATGSTLGYRAFAGLDWSFAFLFGLSLEVFQTFATIDEFTMGNSFDPGSNSAVLASGQNLKRYNQTMGAISDQGLWAVLNNTGAKLSLYLDF